MVKTSLKPKILRQKKEKRINRLNTANEANKYRKKNIIKKKKKIFYIINY